jgi:hypothetical protein
VADAESVDWVACYTGRYFRPRRTPPPQSGHSILKEEGLYSIHDYPEPAFECPQIRRSGHLLLSYTTAEIHSYSFPCTSTTFAPVSKYHIGKATRLMASATNPQSPAQGVGPDYHSESPKPTATVSTKVSYDNVIILPQTPQLIALLTYVHLLSRMFICCPACYPLPLMHLEHLVGD